jgi:phosphatidylcholine synthase
VIGAWLVHLYTASGAVLGFLAAADVTQSDYRGAFMWLTAAVVVDATDGFLARAARVQERLPWFQGDLLDNIIDYVTYVFVPALIVWQSLLVGDAWSLPVCAAMLLSSAYGFSRADAKTEDHFFTGFPSYWNIVVFYLFVAQWPAQANATILLTLALLVFVPIRYVYPSRTMVLRRVTLLLGTAWAAAMLLMLGDAPGVSPALLWASLLFPVYYLILSLALTLRRPSAGQRSA